MAGSTSLAASHAGELRRWTRVKTYQKAIVGLLSAVWLLKVYFELSDNVPSDNVGFYPRRSDDVSSDDSDIPPRCGDELPFDNVDLRPRCGDHGRFVYPPPPDSDREVGKAFCEWAGGRLPTEAEREYACRAGSTEDYCFANDRARLGEYAWCKDNSGESTHPVGRRKPNAWAIHDMHGNVGEWTSSKYHSYPYKADYWREGSGDTVCRRIFRGGDFGVIDCRSTLRMFITASRSLGNTGLRPCLSARAPK